MTEVLMFLNEFMWDEYCKSENIIRYYLQKWFNENKHKVTRTDVWI